MAPATVMHEDVVDQEWKNVPSSVNKAALAGSLWARC